MKKTYPLGFFNDNFLVEKLDKLGNPFQKLDHYIDWTIFEAAIDEHFNTFSNIATEGGRPQFNKLMLFKALLIQHLYKLSDDQLEYQLIDRTSFKRFLGLKKTDKVPNSKDFRTFREQLIENDIIQKLFFFFNETLNAAGIVVNEGKMEDAGFVEALHQTDSPDDNKLKNDYDPFRIVDEKEFIGSKEKTEDSEAKYLTLLEKIKQERILLRTIIDSIPDSIYVKDLESRKILANKANCQNCGVEKEEDVLGKTDFDIFSSEIAENLFDDDKKVMKEGVCVLNREEFIKRPSFEKYLLTSKLPLYSDKGAIIGLVGIGRDITQYKKAEVALRKSEAHLSALFSSMSEMVAVHELVFDKEGKPVDYRYTDCNDAFTKITGKTRDSVFGLLSTEVFGTEEPPYLDEYSKVVLTGEPNNFETYFAPLGKHFSVSVVKPGNNHFATVSTDVTERKKHEFILQKYSEDIATQNENLNKAISELNIAKEKAEESDRLKSAFLANMSHEIRTPMNGILGFTDLLLNPDFGSEEKEEFIKIVQQSGQRMLSTVNDIIEVSKIEAGLVQLYLSKTDVNRRIEELCLFFQAEAGKKGIKLSLEMLLPLSDKDIITDQNKLDSILTNLIKNAIKYTESGSITMGCQLKGPEIQFHIEDTGLGIPKQRQKAIFERFIQADITVTRVFEGSGLGLTISKSYVDMLGGKIWVESEEGKGSVFYFTLPVKSAISEELPDNNEKSFERVKSDIKSLKILITEDDSLSRVYISHIVNDFAREILEVETGIEAIEACRNTKDLDLILMDIQMPEMNGYETTRRIREFNKDVVIIAQTAFALSGDRKKALNAGCNEYISKPINRKELLTLIRKYFGE